VKSLSRVFGIQNSGWGGLVLDLCLAQHTLGCHFWANDSDENWWEFWL